jgi:hypothetical protein
MVGLLRFCLWQQAQYPLAVSSVRASRKAVLLGGAYLPPTHPLFSNWKFRNVQWMVTTTRWRQRVRESRCGTVKEEEEEHSSSTAGVMGASPIQLLLVSDLDSTMVCASFLLPPKTQTPPTQKTVRLLGTNFSLGNVDAESLGFRVHLLLQDCRSILDLLLLRRDFVEAVDHLDIKQNHGSIFLVSDVQQALHWPRWKNSPTRSQQVNCSVHFSSQHINIYI